MQYSRPPRACINLTESHEIPFLRQYILQLRRKNNTPFPPCKPYHPANCPPGGGTQTTSSPPFFLRESRASETRARVKITPREKRRHAAGREKNDVPAACRLFSRGVIFTRARFSPPLLSLRKNGGLLVVQAEQCWNNLSNLKAYQIDGVSKCFIPAVK